MSGRSSFDQHITNQDAKVEIVQTWTRITIVMSTPNSSSRSLIAGILTGQRPEDWLLYEYLNEPKPGAPEGMHAHRGMARLAVKPSGGRIVLDGEYYSGRDRANQGTLLMTRVPG